MCAAGGALELQLRVDCQYDRCWWWVRRSLGQCVGVSVSGKMLSGEMGLRGWGWFARTSGLGGVTKTSKFKPKRCILDPTYTTASDVASPKMVRFIPVNGC
jgi:hypothetical protein